MKDIFKGLWKWIVWIAAILAVGALVLAFRIFVLDRNYNLGNSKNSSSLSSANNGKNGSNSKNSSNAKNGSNSGNSKNSSKNENGSSNNEDDDSKRGIDLSNIDLDEVKEKAGEVISDISENAIAGGKFIKDATVKGYKEDEDDYTYNKFNFDDRILFYEGEQYDEAVKTVLDLLIENANETFYDRTAVTATNFGGNVSISFNGDVSEYQNSLRNLKNAVSSGMYDVSFKYAGIMTFVNEIVITKK